MKEREWMEREGVVCKEGLTHVGNVLQGERLGSLDTDKRRQGRDELPELLGRPILLAEEGHLGLEDRVVELDDGHGGWYGVDCERRGCGQGDVKGGRRGWSLQEQVRGEEKLGSRVRVGRGEGREEDDRFVLESVPFRSREQAEGMEEFGRRAPPKAVSTCTCILLSPACRRSHSDHL